jgi:hypothetical protein
MAGGVIVIAAFLGLSLLFRCGLASALLEVAGLEDDETGFDLCASDSGRLMLAASSAICVFWSDIRGGLVSLSSGLGPAMDVSAMPLFRGGGGKESGRL